MDSLPPRNNTNFQQSVINAINNLQKNDILRFHQVIPTQYVKNNPLARGLLVYHKMGSGKTWVGADLAYELGNLGYTVIFLSAKSLHSNARKGLREYIKARNPDYSDEKIEEILEKYTYVSTKNRATVRRVLEGGEGGSSVFKVENTSLNNTLIIVDEAHNMFNGILSGSKSDTALYDLIMSAKNIKLVFLTGQPIVNSPGELMPAFNMLSGTRLFGESYDDFINAFVERKHGGIKNKNKFQNRIMGLVSYYEARGNEDKFPEQKLIIVEKIPMSEPQFAEYSTERDKEIRQTSQQYLSRGRPQRLTRGEKKSSTYRVQTRQICNAYFPNHARKDGKRLSDLLTKDDLSNIDVISPKIKRCWENIKKQKSHGLFYSQFVEAGVGLMARMLEHNGYIRIRSPNDLILVQKNKQKGYGILYGEADVEESNFIISVYNSPENIRGEIMHMLLITSKAAEGTDLKAGRHIHICEPYWNWSRILQVIARLIRENSHSMLPKEERNVQVYMYLSDYPNDVPKEKKSEELTDMDIYMSARRGQKINNSFLKALQEVSIDCTAHSGENCRVCMPTNERLFVDDMLQDLKTSDKCSPIVKTKLKVEEIKTDNGTFYFAVNEGNIRIFAKNKQLGGIIEIFGDNPNFDNLYELIYERL